MSNYNTVASRLRAAHERDANSIDEWRESKMALALLYAEARALHESHIAFGHWLVDNDLLVVGHQERAALIKLGQEPDKARILLAETERMSVRYIVEDEWPRRFTCVGKTTPSGSVPVESVVIAAQPEVLSESTEPKEPPAERITTSEVAKPQPKIVRLIGNAGVALYERIGGKNTMQMLCEIAAAKGGKAAVREYAATLLDHPEWKPIALARVMTVRIFHEDFGRNAIELPRTASGLRRAISLALEEEKRAKEPPRPSLLGTRVVFTTETTTEAPTARIEPFERPSVDADIVVYGTVIRRPGEYPEHYQEAWQAARFILMIDGANGRPDRASVASRGVGYGSATHFLRGCASQMFCHYWQQIAYAMSKPVDLDAGIQIAPARMRAA